MISLGLIIKKVKRNGSDELTVLRLRLHARRHLVCFFSTVSVIWREWVEVENEGNEELTGAMDFVMEDGGLYW